MAIAGVATELFGLTPWHMPAPMHAHAQACRSSSAPAGPLPLHAHARATPRRSRPPLPSRSPQPPHQCAPCDTHPGRAPHSRWLRSPRLLPPIPSLAPLSRPCLTPPPVATIFCWPHLCPPPPAARLACCVLLHAAMHCSTTGTLLHHALDIAVDKRGGGIVNGVRGGGGGEGVERQEVWGGVTWLWWRCLCEKERSQLERIAKKIITWRSQFKIC